MLKWNRTINLTAIRKLDEIVERHYAECVFAASLLGSGVSVVDVGSGAGFPGIPIAIVVPGASVTLVESHQRKAAFLREATREMRNVRVVSRRAEEVEGGFDWLVSRAVSGEDLTPVLGLGRSIMLLTGAEEAPAVAGVEWESAPMPWGKRRFVRVGSRAAR
jgi:16S rRNA (guanine527-N7)-methyltransferase